MGRQTVERERSLIHGLTRRNQQRLSLFAFMFAQLCVPCVVGRFLRLVPFLGGPGCLLSHPKHSPIELTGISKQSDLEGI